MGNLEVFIFAASLSFALTGWVTWYRDLFSVNRLRDLKLQRAVLFVLPIFCLTLLIGVLIKQSAQTVRDDPLYFGFYLLLGLGWLGGATLIFPFLGVGARDDVLERSNSSAIWPVAGALLGISFSYVGANIGHGPGVEAVLLSAFLSSGLFFALWFAVEVLTSVSEMVTVERDASPGIRIAGLLLGVGVLNGWSVSGDWISAEATLKDFVRFSWPTIFLAATAVVVEFILSRTMRKPFKVVSFFISLLYVSVAIAWAAARGLR